MLGLYAHVRAAAYQGLHAHICASASETPGRVYFALMVAGPSYGWLHSRVSADCSSKTVGQQQLSCKGGELSVRCWFPLYSSSQPMHFHDRFGPISGFVDGTHDLRCDRCME